VLGSTTRPLCEAYDLAMLDLDGVVYIGGVAVEGAPDHLARARDQGLRIAFVTNNASRSPAEVAQHLGELGVDAAADDVVTSAQAAARLLAQEHGPGARIALLGADGLARALREEGLEPVAVGEESAVAVVSGYAPEVPWKDVMRAAVRIRDGLPWVASNTDMTIPTAYGVAPGHGVLVETLHRFTRVDPVVAGKPQRPLLDETIRRVGGRAPLMVGDRLDTDIEGAVAVGVDSLLVLTGVTGLDELVAAAKDGRPTYLAPDLGALVEPQPAPEREDDTWTLATWTLGGWSAGAPDGRVEVRGEGSAADWWRVVAEAAWDHLDRSGEPVDTAGLTAPAATG
jgi:HAD superfamily hydrolase (TIGR01450 family)